MAEAPVITADGPSEGSSPAVRAFDRRLAQYPVRRVRLERVIDPLSSTHRPERIEEYRAQMRAGDRFPPISVIGVAGRFVVADGHKRLTAYRALGAPEIDVEIWPYRRLLADHWMQTRRNLRKLRRMAGGLFYDQAEAKRLAVSMLLHWRRVAASLVLLASDHTWRRAGAAGGGELRRLVRDVTPWAGWLALGLLFSALSAGAQLSLIWFVKEGVEGPLLAGDRDGLARLAWKAVLTVTLGGVALVVARTATARVSHGFVEDLRCRAVERLLAAELGVLQRHQVGELISRLTSDASGLLAFATHLRRLVRESALIGGALALLFVLDPRLALAACVLLPLAFGVFMTIGRRIRRRGSRAQAALGALTAVATESLYGVMTVKASQAEAVERQRFGERARQVRREAVRADIWSAVLMAAVFVGTGAAVAGMFFYGALRVAEGEISSGTLLAFSLYTVQAVEPLRRLSEVHAILQGVLVAASRVYEVIDVGPREAPDEGGRLQWPATVSLENVEFAYPSGGPVLHGVSLTLQPGEQLALVGQTGSGKTTIALLLLRFYKPTAGRIVVGGRDLQTIALADVRRHIAIVAQDPFLFRGSLVENVRYGAPQATEKTVQAAIERAGLEPLVRRLPAGIRTDLAELGRSLSGGERQRIALARALLREPDVLVLDEATSAVDSQTELEIFDRLTDWLRRRTVLLIGHRLATVVKVPRIVLLEGGRVAADGPTTDLLTAGSGLARLFADQVDAGASFPFGVP